MESVTETIQDAPRVSASTQNITVKVSSTKRVLKRLGRKIMYGTRVCAALLVFPITATSNTVLLRKRSKVRDRLLEAVIHEPTGRAALGSRHPNSAIARSNEDKLINHLTTRANRYYVSLAQRDGDSRGTHAYYGPIDYTIPAKTDLVLPDDVITAIDADYYMSPDQFRQYSGHDFVFRTFKPEELSAVREEYAYTHCSDGSVKMSVKGGATYEHPRWDYDVDQCTIASRTTIASMRDAAKKGFLPLSCELMNMVANLFGKDRIYYVYRVDSRDTSQDHAIVSLTATARVYNPKPKRTRGAAKFTSTMLKPLKHVEGGGSKYLMRKIHTNTGMQVQACSEDSYETISISEAVHTAIRAQGRRIGEKQSIANVMCISNAERAANKEEFLTQGAAEILFDLTADARASTLSRISWGRANIAVNVPESSDKIRKSISEKNPGPVDRSGETNPALAVGPSLTSTPAAVPDGGQATLADAAQRRMLDVAADNSLPIPQDIQKFRHEFVRELTKNMRCVKLTREQVVAQLKRPVQKLRAQESQDLAHQPFEASIFVKGETLGDIGKPARVIVSPNIEHNLEYAAYISPMEEYMKANVAWYTPGKNPTEIALQLRRFITKLEPDQTVVDTDYSRYDGTKVDFLRYIEYLMMEKAYPEGEHGTIKRLYKAENNMTLKSKNKGIKLKTTSQTGSGTRGTTLFNTIENAFVPFVRNRRQGMSVSIAFISIGPKNGDDSKEVGPMQGLIDVATSLQLKLTGEVEHRGSETSYLGRVYPDVMSYEGSIPAVMRLAKKMHISFMRGAAPAVALAKAQGFLASDSHVPLFSDYARWITRKHRRVKAAELDRETQWKIANGEMPKGLPDTTLALIAHGLNTTVEHCQALVKLLKADAPECRIEEFFVQAKIQVEGCEGRVATERTS